MTERAPTTIADGVDTSLAGGGLGLCGPLVAFDERWWLVVCGGGHARRYRLSVPSSSPGAWAWSGYVGPALLRRWSGGWQIALATEAQAAIRQPRFMSADQRFTPDRAAFAAALMLGWRR